MGRRWTRIEDNLLKDLAGKVTAEQIGLVLGRTKTAVHDRISKKKLNGHLHGEHHWAAKLPTLVAGMAGALHDAGYTPAEIHKMITEQHDVSRSHLEAICNSRARVRDTAAQRVGVRPTRREEPSPLRE